MGILVLMLALAASSADELTVETVGRRQIARAPYDVVRDGYGTMRLEPLPFAKDRPEGLPDFDVWQAHGYESTVTEQAGAAKTWVTRAIAAGICQEQQPCVFSFVYLMAIQETHTAAGKIVAIRYLLTVAGSESEGLLWSPQDGVYRYFLRGATTWQEVGDEAARKRLSATVEAFLAYHTAAIAAIRGRQQ